MSAKKLRSKVWEDQIEVKDSYNELANLLTESDVPLNLTTFDDFVQTIFSKGFPEYDFNTWHIRKVATMFDTLLKDPTNKYLLAVLPRYHLKSTLLGYATSIYRMLTTSGEGLYTSYKEELAGVHLYHIKEAIRGNKLLSSVMEDLSPQSDSTINYRIGNRRCKIYASGMMAVKRGLHTGTICIGDDLMGDVTNPMNMTEMDKTIQLFDAELLNIPNKDCPLIVFGTVISDNDLLFHLKDKPKFSEHTLWLPAINPDSEHEVLWEKRYDKAWLDDRKTSGGWKAFSTEFLLMPVMSTLAFLPKELLDKVIDSSLTNYGVPGW